jgi:hypothetical protein
MNKLAHGEYNLNYRIKDLAGQVFGYLTAISATTKRNRGRVVWECQCNCSSMMCPKTVYCSARDLINGDSSSCRLQQFDKTVHIAIRNYYVRLRARVKRRNLKFDLTLTDFRNIIKAPCYYCGSVSDKKHISTTHKVYLLRANGIDRYNNDKGYIVTNCVSCCWHCNSMKGTRSGDEIIAWAKSIAAVHNAT